MLTFSYLKSLFQLSRLKYQSESSNSKISFTVFPNTLDIFSANTVDGTYFPNSSALMVCLLTLTFSESSACVKLAIALSIFNLFFIEFFIVFINRPSETYDEKQQI